MIRFILGHKLLVVMAWVVLSAIGILTLPRIGPRLDYTYTTKRVASARSAPKIMP